MSEDDDDDIQIVVIGDAGVGKTSLIHQLTKKQLSLTNSQTIDNSLF